LQATISHLARFSAVPLSSAIWRQSSDGNRMARPLE
jgi:hypothetical protein